MATVKQSGGDYSTLNAAFAGSETTISIEGTWTSADTTKATCSTASTTVTADSSSKHSGYIEASPSYYRLEGSSGHCITVSADNLSITGIVIKQAGTGGSDEGVRVNGDYTLSLTDCYLYGLDGGNFQQDGIYARRSGTVNITVTQCIFHDWGRTAYHIQDIADSGTYTNNINSCTFFLCGYIDFGPNILIRGDTGATNTQNIHNTICLDSYDSSGYMEQGTGTFTWNISYSIDEYGGIADVIDTGTGNLASRTATDNTSPGAGDYVIFNDVTTYPYDLRLYDNATDNDAQDAHTTATAHSLTIPSTDIAGTSRPQNTSYDIGTYEIAAAAASLPLATRRRRFINLLNH